MNYTICDHTHLEHELAKANAIAKEGGVSLTMVNASLLQFDHKDVVRVRGALYSENGAPCESVAEVILIQHEGLVVGEVSVLTREEALSSPGVPTMSHVDALWPRLVDHLREIAFHLSPREMSNDHAATQAPSHEDGPPKSAHAVRVIQRLEELRQDIRDRRRRGASVAPPDDFTLTRDSQTVTSHSDGACATLPRSEETGQTTRTRRLKELRADIRVRNELIRAFDSGVVSNYVRAVIDAGAIVAAETLTTYLCSSSIGQEALRTTSAHLINPKILRDVPGAELFVARMYSKLSDATLEMTEDGKVVLIRALLPFTETEDLCEIHPLSFRGPEVRLMAEGVPVLPRPLEWAKAAIAFEDEDLFELVRPQLSADDLFVLWKEVAGYTTTEVTFLIGRNVLLGAADEKRCVFDLLPSVGQNQSEIAALLTAAWSDVAATYEITPAREPHAFSARAHYQNPVRVRCNYRSEKLDGNL